MKLLKEPEWIFPDESVIELGKAIAKEWNIPPVFAQILIRRGIEEKEVARNFLKPSIDNLYDPFLFNGMEKAVERLSNAQKNKETILILGDYDVDGICSTALLYRVMKKFGFEVHCHIPDRFTEGYGISDVALKKSESIGASLIITVDSGITAAEAVEEANKRGIDIIITDHHVPGNEIPSAHVILNPQLKDSGYPFKFLAGVGVGFKLMEAFCLHENKNVESLYDHLDLVALGTAADVVPLVDENRNIVACGLEKMTYNKNIGLAVLKRMAGVNENSLGTGQLVYQLAPRLNAAGRIESGKIALQLLITDNLSEAEEIVAKLEMLNETRKQMEQEVFDDATMQLEWLYEPNKDAAIVLSSGDWHQGVIGIVASRLVERYHLPAILIAAQEHEARGSARSVQGFDIMKAFSDCSDIIDNYGGHKYAAGFTVRNDAIEDFRRRFLLIAGEMAPAGTLHPSIRIDGTLNLKDIDENLISLIKRLEPFGSKNIRPIFTSSKVEIVGSPYIVGKNHLKFRVRQEGSIFDCIGFNMGEHLHRIGIPRKNMEIAYSLEENHWGGKQRLELRLKAIR